LFSFLSLGYLFFCGAALTRNIVCRYLQGVALFVAFLLDRTGVGFVTDSNTWAHLGLPHCRSLGSHHDSKLGSAYWAVVEKNTLTPHWTGVFSHSPPGFGLVWVWQLVPSLSVFCAFSSQCPGEVLGSRASTQKAAEARTDEDNEKRRPRLAVAQLRK